MSVPSQSDPVIRIAQINDPHLDTVPPARRTDDYFTAIGDKLHDILAFCKMQRVDCAVCTGDLFHKSDGSRVPYRLTSFYINYFKKFRDANISVMAIPGNHDLLMRPVLDNQPIRALYEAELLIYPGESTIFEKNGLRVNFSGTSFYYDIDKDRRGYMMDRDSSADWNIKIAHGMLLPNDTKFFDEWTNPSDLRDFEGDFIMCGHYHDYLGLFPGAGAGGRPFTCANFGSVSRGSVSGYKTDRLPEFAVLTLSRHKGEWSHHVIPSALPYDQVFAIDQYLDERERAERMEEVVASISTMATAGFGHRSVEEMFSEATQGLSASAKSLAREYFIRAREETT